MISFIHVPDCVTYVCFIFIPDLINVPVNFRELTRLIKMHEYEAEYFAMVLCATVMHIRWLSLLYHWKKNNETLFQTVYNNGKIPYCLDTKPKVKILLVLTDQVHENRELFLSYAL